MRTEIGRPGGTQGVAIGIIAEVSLRSEALLLDPEPGNRVEAEIDALELMLDAARKAIQKVSTSSSPLYALRDIPAAAQDHLKKATHALRLLRATYGPQPERTTTP